MRSWRVSEPRQRMALRLVALCYPLVVIPAFLALFPFRLEEPFHDGPAILVARRWAEVRFLGVGLFEWWLALFAGLGALLFLMDLVPLLRGRRRPRPARRRAGRSLGRRARRSSPRSPRGSASARRRSSSSIATRPSCSAPACAATRSSSRAAR